MVDYLKHKWVYYALSVLVAAFAAHESVGLLCFLGIISAWCAYRGFQKIHVVAVIAVGLLTFSYFSGQLTKQEQPFMLPATMTFTDTYKINGSTLRGLMKDDEGRVVYIVYTFQSEQEKNTYEKIPLARNKFYVEGVIEAPSKPAHKYHFYMGDYLKSKGAIGILNVTQLRYIGRENSVLQRIYEQRFLLSEHIHKVFPASLAAEAEALIIGIQDQVDAEITRAYQKLGITHLFAISGLHVALISWMFFQGLLRLRVRRELATLVLIVILPIYALLAGGAPSVWRAVSVVEFVMLARYFNWRIPIDDALAISFIVFVLLQPGAVYQVGFQLSYLATVSLIYSGPILAKARTWWMQGFLMTFVCQLLTYPILLLHFYELSLSSFLANVIFVPLFSFVILPINIVLLLISFIPGPFANWLFALYEPARTFLTEVILFLQSVPYQMWVPGKPSVVWMIVLYASVFTTFICLTKGTRYWRIVVVLLTPALLFQLSHYVERDATISFINVGQGDCILIELPHRQGVYMIDTGGLLRFRQEAWKERQNVYEVGTQIVVPYLKGKGITSLDTLIISHADADHVEAAEEVLKEIRIKEIHITPQSHTKDAMQDLLAEAKKQRVPIKEQIAGVTWQKGNALFRYIWPTDTNYEGNNDSLVLMMTYGAFKALFTGDLEEAGEQVLIRQEGANIANVDVLKAGHHGSKTSSSDAFIEHVRPRLTIFMAGKDNRYGHPHAEVVDRLKSRNLPYLTTGEDGTIEVRMNEQHMKVSKQ
ncbi:MAG: DNA internalization-related competence protein ComEC/Rec2 [Lysinibacillus sp.]